VSRLTAHELHDDVDGSVKNGTSAPRAIAVQNLSKTFGGVRALRNVDWEVRRGEIHALVGGNGSGKSTLVKILAGVHQADPGGTIAFDSAMVDVGDMSPGIAHSHGLRFVHQALGLFPDLSVAENLAAGNGFPLTRYRRIRWRAARRQAATLLERFKIPAEPQWPLRELRPAHQTMLAVARALRDDVGGSTTVSTLVLDEPTALLPLEEVDLLLDAVRGYAEQGSTIIYISHRLDEVIDLADTVTVLRDGQRVTTRSVEGLDAESIVSHMLGRPITRMYPEVREAPERGALCEVDGLTGGPVKGVSLRLRKGEILGVAGVSGSGCSELLELMFGARKADSGTVTLDGEKLSLASPAQAADAGIAYVPSNRAEHAAFMDQSVRENLFAGRTLLASHPWRVSKARERRDARKLIERFAIVAPDESVALSALSGGNQQKVMLARWLGTAPKLLLLVEPTQGVDVGSRADIYRFIREASEEGTAVVISSADFDEIAHLCDRVLVLVDGVVKSELASGTLTGDALTESVLLSTERAGGH
jgi:ribose transport system ATP-binding protein